VPDVRVRGGAMCAVRCRLTDLCQQIAQLEYELEQELCDLKERPKVKEYALGLLKRRGDTRAEQILLSYMGPVDEERILEKLLR